jgi:peptide/nickel transport system permease protein
VLSVTGIPESAADDPQYAERIAEARADLNLDDPIPVAYAQWLGDLLPPDVDLGFSYVRNTEVSELLNTAIPRTALLMIYSVGLSLLLAIPLGVLAAYKAGGWVDRVISTSAFGLIAIPNFVVAVVVIYVFAIKLGWFPATNVKDLGDAGLVEHLKSYALPVFSLAVGQTAVFARLLRTDMVTTLSEDYIGMAKAKGMPVRTILFRHALRPSSFTLMTVVGINVGQLLGGSVVIEFLFNINGLGSQLAAAVQRSDYILVQAGVMIIATAFILLNFAVDVLYGFLDPRVRHARSH